ncbi:RidA family protein [Cellulomonas phragmiteti]|uniref:Enamine deaminase RidA n=1 Tax=Cellulomonas phragmiteti TaxID=478780 RepID=A0ABQ4DHF7_9CELL|nr:RidA family protein [Cellulomonas phragmiteti]GIG38759.1 enamine deaminase RidA [Cellulomonas phragmiteti]
MPVQLLSPAGLMQPVPYHHVAVGTGARQVHVAGQVARDAAGRPVADDLAGQVAAVLRSTALALDAAGARFTDVVRLTFYVTRWRPEEIADLMAGVESVADELGLPTPMPPASLLGVDQLYEPDVRVELETVAVLD